jgi:hypothetical protein
MKLKLKSTPMKTKTIIAALILSATTHAPAQYGTRPLFLPDAATQRQQIIEQNERMIELQQEAMRDAESARVSASIQAWTAELERQTAARNSGTAGLQLLEQATRRNQNQGWTRPPSPTEAPVTLPPAAPRVSMRNPYEPSDESAPIPTLAQFSASRQNADPLDTIRQYRHVVQLGLLKAGQYDAEIAAEVDQELFNHAVEKRLLDTNDAAKANAQFFAPLSNEAANDAALIHRQAMEDGDTEAAEAALRYKAMLSEHVRSSHSDPGEYQDKLSAAKLNFNSVVKPEKITAARLAAVERGDIPFAFVNYRIRLWPGLKKSLGNDAALAKIFEDDPTLDRNLIGAVWKELRNP